MSSPFQPVAPDGPAAAVLAHVIGREDAAHHRPRSHVGRNGASLTSRSARAGSGTAPVASAKTVSPSKREWIGRIA
jgi:hypothetical protein